MPKGGFGNLATLSDGDNPEAVVESLASLIGWPPKAGPELSPGRGRRPPSTQTPAGEPLRAPRQVDHRAVGKLHRAADRHRGDEFAFGLGENLVHLSRRQDQRVTGSVTYFTIGHHRPAASLEEQHDFLRIVTVRRSRRVGVHSAAPHLDLSRAARGRGHPSDMVALQAVDPILLLVKDGHGSNLLKH